MRKMILTVLLTAMMSLASAQTNPLWMRYSAISPDGKTIAFSYKGDIFTVPVQGGEARQLTTNAAYDSHPVWSPDSRQIAFSSTREGGHDVYVMAREGGVPVRLTTHSGSEIPVTFRDNGHVLFTAALMPTAQSNIFASSKFPQIYEVSVKGGRPRLFSGLPMADLNINSRGDLLYHDIKGGEDVFRKHHQSPICRDIWLLRDGKYTQLTDFKGEDRNPVWGADGQGYYYLSEKDGTSNIYKRSLDGKTEVQLTRHQKNPVRYLSRSNDGLLCYGYDGEIYLLREGGQPQKVHISIHADNDGQELIREVRTSGATEISVSPNGKEVAFVLHGDVFVTATDYKTTRQITDTPEQERNIHFAPDGRSIAYAAERGGYWQIYQTRLTKADEKLFTYATELKEERLTETDRTSFQPLYSPDGKQIAYLEDRGTLRVIDLKTKQIRTVMDGKFNFSYSDGDQWFNWSPDSRWLITSYIGLSGWHHSDIALVNASGNGEIHNLTNSGYSDGNGKFVLGGKAMLFSSDRNGYRSHGGSGAERDYYLMFFDVDAYERFLMTKEEKMMQDEAQKEAKGRSQEAKGKEQSSAGKKKQSPATQQMPSNVLTFDLDNCRKRIVRLTNNSSRLGDAVLKGDSLYYQAAFEGGYDLWLQNTREKKTELLQKNIGSGTMSMDNKQKTLFMVGRGGIKKLDLAKGKPVSIDFEAVFNYRPNEERAYIFDHIWQQVKDKFYVKDLHGCDWEGYRDIYRRFLPYINNNYDFRDMLSELLGELDASHTGSRYRPDGATLKTAALGIFADNSFEGDGIRIEEVIGNGPFSIKNTGVKAGDIIERIDGTVISGDMDYNCLLDGKAGKNVRVTVFSPGNGQRRDVTIKPISTADQNELLYDRWVERNRKMVEDLSGGRVAYMHVKQMNSECFRKLYDELLNEDNRNKEAVIIDERHNGGGWLHDDLCTLLSGRQYSRFEIQGKYLGIDPYNKWTKPSCVMVCEDDYSNGCGFPRVYQDLGVGKLIGTPVAGTVTSVWWETVINGMIFGIPQVGRIDNRGHYGENTELVPEIIVYKQPDDILNGRDPQLERAVKEMLKEADANASQKSGK